MRFVALAIVVGALPCQAFRPWTRPAWEGVAIVEPVTSVEPWRTARWYNYLVVLTLPEDEEEG